MFELFNMVWLNTFGGDSSLFIFNPTFSERDMMGIDLFAVNKDNNTVCIQSKFVGNSQTVFGEEGGILETFFGKSAQYITANPKLPGMILFTTATKVGSRYKTLERDGSMVIIDKKRIDDFASKSNIGFWNGCKILGEKLFD
jgi:hypothetical protein